MAEQKRVIWFDRLRMSDIEQVGGKNASLGEMIAQLGAEGVRVPGGFATTASAFREFGGNQLKRAHREALAGLDVDDVAKLGSAPRFGLDRRRAASRGAEDRNRGGVQRLNADSPGVSVAVRSSATAEDMPDASFAGQQETFLNISGLTILSMR
jgi:pyruvate,water dikinase